MARKYRRFYTHLEFVFGKSKKTNMKVSKSLILTSTKDTMSVLEKRAFTKITQFSL